MAKEYQCKMCDRIIKSFGDGIHYSPMICGVGIKRHWRDDNSVEYKVVPLELAVIHLCNTCLLGIQSLKEQCDYIFGDEK